MTPLWRIKRDATQPHWLELRDPEGWYRATVKWDGCIHFYRAFNGPMGMDEADPSDDPSPQGRNIEYMHLCDLDDTIARLQALKTEALRFFGEDWPA